MHFARVLRSAGLAVCVLAMSGRLVGTDPAHGGEALDVQVGGQDPHDDAARKAAGELWRAAEDAKKKELFGESRRQSLRVLALDGNHRGARSLLGFVRKGDVWTEDAALAAKTPHADLPGARPGTDVRPTLRDWRARTLRAAEKRGADLFVSLAVRLVAAGDHEGARKARLAAVALVPDYESVRGALGQIRWKDVWVAPEQQRRAESARTARTSPGSGDLAGVVGGVKLRVETARCVFLSDFPAERIVPLAQACEDVMSLLYADLGRNADDSPAATKLHFVVCADGSQWNLWVEGTQLTAQRDFFRRLHGVWGPHWSYGVRVSDDAEDPDAQLRDHVAHRAAHWAVTQGFGVPWVSWLDEGLTHHYVLRSEERTGTWCANPGADRYSRDVGNPAADGWIDAAEWRDLVWRMVSADDLIPLRALAMKKIHEQPTVAAVEAWSFVSWWRWTNPEGFRAFLANTKRSPDVTLAVETGLKAKIEDAQESWRSWVLFD